MPAFGPQYEPLNHRLEIPLLITALFNLLRTDQLRLLLAVLPQGHHSDPDAVEQAARILSEISHRGTLDDRRVKLSNANPTTSNDILAKLHITYLAALTAAAPMAAGSTPPRHRPRPGLPLPSLHEADLTRLPHARDLFPVRRSPQGSSVVSSPQGGLELARRYVRRGSAEDKRIANVQRMYEKMINGMIGWRATDRRRTAMPPPTLAAAVAESHPSATHHHHSHLAADEDAIAHLLPRHRDILTETAVFYGRKTGTDDADLLSGAAEVPLSGISTANRTIVAGMQYLMTYLEHEIALVLDAPGSDNLLSVAIGLTYARDWLLRRLRSGNPCNEEVAPGFRIFVNSIPLLTTYIPETDLSDVTPPGDVPTNPICPFCHVPSVPLPAVFSPPAHSHPHKPLWTHRCPNPICHRYIAR